VELSESVPSAQTLVWIVLEKIELVEELVQKPTDHQPELLAHLEQKLALPTPRFQADL
jgi:hypothetical protein